MAPRRTGTVKPPVIDLTARPAEEGVEAPVVEPAAVEDATPVEAEPVVPEQPAPRPEPEPVAEPEPMAPSSAPEQPIRNAGPASPFLLLSAAIAGGALGALLAYLLALGGLWPATQPPIADPAPAIGRLDTEISTLKSNIQAAADAAAAAAGEARSASEAVAALPAPSTGQATDLAPIETEIADLRTRLETLAASPATATDPTLTQGLADLSTQLTDLDARFAALDQRLTAAESGLAAAAAEPEPAPEPVVDPVPGALDNLETAFLSGRPYTSAMVALTSARPDLAVPESLITHAATGLVSPDILNARYTEILPAMLAARPVAANGDWQTTTLDWLKAMLAMRPADEMAGDDPDAVISRLDAAIARKDYRAASDLFAALPEPMRLAAGALVADIAAQADATAFIEAQRAALLAATQSGATN